MTFNDTFISLEQAPRQPMRKTAALHLMKDDDEDNHTVATEVSEDDMSDARSAPRVRFSTVQVREYNVVLDDCETKNACKMTLGWEYRQRSAKAIKSGHKDALQRPTRLNTEERRRRIALVQGTNAEQVRRLEKIRFAAKCAQVMADIDAVLQSC